jgi:hypothetical protein
MDQRIKEIEKDVAEVCKDVEEQKTWIMNAMQAQTEKLSGFEERMFMKMDALISATHTEQGLVSALGARVQMSEQRITFFDAERKATDNKLSELSGILKYMSTVIKDANPTQTKADLEGLAAVVHAPISRKEKIKIATITAACSTLIAIIGPQIIKPILALIFR